MSYTQKVLDELKARYPEQPEFIQAATDTFRFPSLEEA